MRVVMLASGTRGDAQPMVVLGAELRRRGHEVVLGLPPNLVDFGQRAGLDSRPVGPDTQAFLESPEGQGWLAAGNVMKFMGALATVSHDSIEATDAQVIDVSAGADVIVANVLMEDHAACVAEATGIPVVFLHSAPIRATAAYGHPMITTRRLPGPLNRASGALFDRVWWRGLKGDVNGFRSKLGLAPVRTSTARRNAAAGGLELQVYSSSLVPELDDHGPHRPRTGFLTVGPDERARLGEDAVDPDLDRWLGDGEAPVFFGFGSMPVLDTQAMLALIRRVSAELGVRALVGAGWSTLSDDDDDDRIRVVGTVNHDLVLPRCRAAVHHGGAGTVAASIGAGIPTMVCSVFADQPFWGSRIEALGAGTHIRYTALDEASLTAGVRRCLEPGVERAAQDLSRGLQADGDTAARAADLVEGRLAPVV